MNDNWLSYLIYGREHRPSPARSTKAANPIAHVVRPPPRDLNTARDDPVRHARGTSDGGAMHEGENVLAGNWRAGKTAAVLGGSGE